MTSPETKRSFSSWIGRWMAELVLVFLGAYAAFWLSGYQQHQADARRRDQILGAIEEEAKEGIADAQKGGSNQEARVAEFRRALAAGEMPPMRPISFSSDYSPGDVSTLLQAGGLELLEAKTIFALYAADSAVRGGLSRLAHLEKLSDQLIVPNLDEDISFFYDPTTKQLRKRFAQYPVAMQSIADFFHEEERANKVLFERIQAERKRSW